MNEETKSTPPPKPRPGSYEEFLAENAARLKLPGMVRGLGGCAVEASAIDPFTGKPYSCTDVVDALLHKTEETP